MKILILGGYGVFGGRLAELLSDVSEIEMMICGRNLSRAKEFCETFQGIASVRPLQIDRNLIDQALRDARPDIVVDASGPFQNYGDDRYSVIKACIDASVNYLDFADASDFVFGVTRFDRKAKDAGVFVLSGVSSFPVLTAAVLREMAAKMDVVTVHGGIAPSPYAGIGLNVMRAVLGYAGGPVKLMRGGVPSQAKGLTESMRFTIAPPGRLPLRNILFSLVDVPDLQVIPTEHETLRDIWMGAGPVPEFLHRILNLLAKVRATFRLPSMAPLAPLFYRTMKWMKYGEHRGGMFVQVQGLKSGKHTQRSWHLLAEADDGPYIPSMAIEAIIKKIVTGERPEPGARPATQALDLADYEHLFEGRAIHTGFRDEGETTDPLYKQLLGSAFDTLPTKVKALHATNEPRRWSGHARVRRGKSQLAKLIGWVIGFPEESDATPVSVDFSSKEYVEKWSRKFGEKSFSSIQKRGVGKNSYLLLERFGLIEVALALVVVKDRLLLVPRRWSLLGMPLPNILLPTGTSFETEKDGSFHFNVEIAAPVVGLIVSYRGNLEPAASSNQL